MANGPKAAETPLETLENSDIFAPSFGAKWYNPIAGATLGFCSSLIGNVYTKRPLLSGVQKHVLFTVGAFFAAMYIDKYNEKKYSRRDEMLRHYITLHPEDFPPFERKKFKDVLEPWIPIRS